MLFLHNKNKLFTTKIFVLLFLVSGCSLPDRQAGSQKHNELKEGVWRGVLQLNDSIALPFNFELIKKGDKTIIEVVNAEEKISIDELVICGDSLQLKMPVFDSEFKCKIEDDSLAGNWINHARTEENSIPFTAYSGQNYRFKRKNTGPVKFSFKEGWEADFSPNTDDHSKARLEFKAYNEKSGVITATFLTTTGDYRYLEGCIDDKTLLLSCFDGSHAFLFKADFMDDGTLSGDFWSGTHGHEKWIARKNDTFRLTNPDSLTYLKNTTKKFNFSFPNLDGKPVSLSDEKYKNKVVMIQIMGSWCPNCMDETAFLSKFYEKYNPQGLEIIALAFEKTPNFEKAKSNIERLKKRFNAQYEFLIAGGSSDKTKASETLSMLNNISSYPTTLFIDRKGEVRKIHTGFSGPATGKHYEEFVKSTSDFVEQLLKSKR